MFGELFKIRNEGFEKNRYLNQIMQNILRRLIKTECQSIKEAFHKKKDILFMIKKIRFMRIKKSIIVSIDSL